MMHWYVYSRWTWNLAPTSFTGGLVVLRWEKKWWILHCWKIFILRVGGYFCFFSFSLYKKRQKNRSNNYFFFLSFPLRSGVAYTSECFPCKPGSFSRVPGSSSCEPCPRDTYSGHGASSCTPCNTSTQYAGMNKKQDLPFQICFES